MTVPQRATRPLPAPEFAEAAAWLALAEVSSDMLALLDAQGTIAWVNPSFVRLSGFVEPVGESLAALLGFTGRSGA